MKISISPSVVVGVCVILIVNAILSSNVETKVRIIHEVKGNIYTNFDGKLKTDNDVGISPKVPFLPIQLEIRQR